MIQNSFIDMESMFKLFEEEEEVHLKPTDIWSVLYYEPLIFKFAVFVP